MSIKLNLYIANLGKYNEGQLVGEWLELPLCEPEDFKEKFSKWLKENIRVAPNTRYEECAIHDYESDIDDLRIGEYENIEELNEFVVRTNANHNHNNNLLKALYVYYDDLEEAIEEIEKGNVYLLEDVCTEADLGWYIVDEGLMGDIPDNLRNYIDHEAIGRDELLGGSYYYLTDYGTLGGLY